MPAVIYWCSHRGRGTGVMCPL